MKTFREYLRESLLLEAKIDDYKAQDAIDNDKNESKPVASPKKVKPMSKDDLFNKDWFKEEK